MNKFYIVMKSKKEVRAAPPNAVIQLKSPTRQEPNPERRDKPLLVPATQTAVKDVLDCIPIEIDEPQNDFKAWI